MARRKDCGSLLNETPSPSIEGGMPRHPELARSCRTFRKRTRQRIISSGRLVLRSRSVYRLRPPLVSSPEWHQLRRDEQISRIKTALLAEMDRPSIDYSDIRNLLRTLSENTVAPWRHLFLTTNWDYLIQREVLALGHTTQPEWSAETHVYHPLFLS